MEAYGGRWIEERGDESLRPDITFLTGDQVYLDIGFDSSFAGNRVFYLAARDQALNNSGWQAMGTWMSA